MHHGRAKQYHKQSGQNHGQAGHHAFGFVALSGARCAEAVGGIAECHAVGGVETDAGKGQKQVTEYHADKAGDDGEQGNERGGAVDFAGEDDGKRRGDGARHQAVGHFVVEMEHMAHEECADYADKHAHHNGDGEDGQLAADDFAVFINGDGKGNGNRSEQEDNALGIFVVGVVIDAECQQQEDGADGDGNDGGENH